MKTLIKFIFLIILGIPSQSVFADIYTHEYEKDTTKQRRTTTKKYPKFEFQVWISPSFRYDFTEGRLSPFGFIASDVSWHAKRVSFSTGVMLEFYEVPLGSIYICWDFLIIPPGKYSGLSIFARTQKTFTTDEIFLSIGPRIKIGKLPIYLSLEYQYEAKNRNQFFTCGLLAGGPAYRHDIKFEF